MLTRPEIITINILLYEIMLNFTIVPAFYSSRINTLAFEWMWDLGWLCFDTNLCFFVFSFSLFFLWKMKHNLHTINPLLSLPPGTYLFQIHFRVVNRDGRGGYLIGGLFNLENTMLSVLHKDLEYKMEKLKNKKIGSHSAEDQNQIRT